MGTISELIPHPPEFRFCACGEPVVLEREYSQDHSRWLCVGCQRILPFDRRESRDLLAIYSDELN